MKPDLTERPDIQRLVHAFYERVRADDMLGRIFDDVAHTDWDAHLPKMVDFWETVLFRSGRFTGNPLTPHSRIVPLTEMGRAQFECWLALFRATVDDLFAGENATHLKAIAEDMAMVIYSKINGVPDPRFEKFSENRP